MRHKLCILLAFLPLAGCGDLPHAKWGQLEGLRTALRSHKAAPYSKRDLDRFDSRYWQLRTALATESLWIHLPSERKLLEARLDLCIEWAEILFKQLERRKEQIRERQKLSLDAVEGGLAAMKARHPDPIMRELLLPAELKAREARLRWESEDYEAVESLTSRLSELYEAAELHSLTSEGRYSDPVLRGLWKEWVQDTVRHSADTGARVMVVDKRRRTMDLYRAGRHVKTYPVDLGRNSAADKLRQGDGATPEGMYRVVRKLGAGQTRYFRALLLDYPNSRDRRMFDDARRAGIVSEGVSIGGLIEIHGEGGRAKDWTDGCIALSNESMGELFDLGFPGMRVTIVGTVDE